MLNDKIDNGSQILTTKQHWWPTFEYKMASVANFLACENRIVIHSVRAETLMAVVTMVAMCASVSRPGMMLGNQGQCSV